MDALFDNPPKMPDTTQIGKSGRRLYGKTGRESLTEAEVAKLIGSVKDLQEKALLMLAISAGIRRADVVAIRKRNVNPDKRSVTFHEAKKKRDRTVYVSRGVMNVLEMLMREKKGEWLFPGYKGSHLSSRSAWDVLNRNLDGANLRRRPFHALRATCYKLCQRKGWTAYEASEHIGDSIRVAMEHYAIPSDAEMEEVTQDKAIL